MTPIHFLVVCQPKRNPTILHVIWTNWFTVNEWSRTQVDSVNSSLCNKICVVVQTNFSVAIVKFIFAVTILYMNLFHTLNHLNWGLGFFFCCLTSTKVNVHSVLLHSAEQQIIHWITMWKMVCQQPLGSTSRYIICMKSSM